jgi:6-phosphogluconate dehydrogenase
MTAGRADFGVVGLAVMGQNLALNAASRGFVVAVFNRTWERTEEFLAGAGRGRGLVASRTAREFVRSLRRPRRLILMVKAGRAVDEMIAQLLPYLARGDVVLDGGNSHYRDTERRGTELAKRGIRFLGTGISGGEAGALHGPSIMPGGDPRAWRTVAPVLRALAAKTQDGPCVTYLGRGSAGHFVKMVHNGIEYAMMQVLAETYDLMRNGLGLPVPKAQQTFARWSGGRLGGYLVEITAAVLNREDEETGLPLVELILDTAAQKGTGRWTTEAALDLGVPVPTITAAVEARVLSGHKRERVAAARLLPARAGRLPGTSAGDGLRRLEGACYAAFLIAYAQGLHLLRRASREKNYGLDLAEVTRIWTGGCIIRSRILTLLRAAYLHDRRLEHLWLSRRFVAAVKPALSDLRIVVSRAARAGIAVPGLASALAYADGLGRPRGPANLIQAQRDYFGAHGYERVDRKGTFHTRWE